MSRFHAGCAVACLLAVALVAPGASVGARAQPASTGQAIWQAMAVMNQRLQSAGAGVRVDSASYLALASSGAIGRTVFFNDRGNRQIPAQYVPGDSRRGGHTGITYTIDQAEGAIDGLTLAQTSAAIDRAMGTWDAVGCSVIPIGKVANPGGDLGVIELIFGLGGSPTIFADVTHAGWQAPGIVPAEVLAITFTFVFAIGPDPTDVDGNGLPDTAFTEILYNDLYGWQINGNVDVETVALHEAGHGLSQEHFGAAFQTGANNLHFAPRAVMNAGYSGVQQVLTGTDTAGHCGIWGRWP